MTQLQDLPRCPKCGSADIETTGHDLFPYRCHPCGERLTEMPPPMTSTEATPLSYSSDTMPPIRRMERDAAAIGNEELAAKWRAAVNARSEELARDIAALVSVEPVIVDERGLRIASYALRYGVEIAIADFLSRGKP